jgi:hypothetical protein
MPLKLTPPRFIRTNFSRRRRPSPKKALLSSEETEKLSGLNKLFDSSPNSLKKPIPSEETNNLEYAAKLFQSPKSLKKKGMGGSRRDSRSMLGSRRDLGSKKRRGQKERRTRKH